MPSDHPSQCLKPKLQKDYFTHIITWTCYVPLPYLIPSLVCHFPIAFPPRSRPPLHHLNTLLQPLHRLHPVVHHRHSLTALSYISFSLLLSSLYRSSSPLSPPLLFPSLSPSRVTVSHDVSHFLLFNHPLFTSMPMCSMLSVGLSVILLLNSSFLHKFPHTLSLVTYSPQGLRPMLCLAVCLILPKLFFPLYVFSHTFTSCLFVHLNIYVP